MKVGIIGGGSIGLLIGSYLAIPHEITIYVRREEQKKIINNDGVFVDNASEPIKVNALGINEMLTEDLLVVCVKQQHLDDILPIIQQRNSETPIIFLQNGMGHIEKLHQMNQQIIVGVIDHGAFRSSDNTILHTGKGRIRLASFKANQTIHKEITARLDQPDFPFLLATDWKQLLHEKLLINTVINPLTALFDVANGMLLENQYLKELARDLCDEAAFVLKIDYTVAWNSVQTVIRNTKSNISSMLKDIRGNTRTEIDAITLYLIQNSKHSIPNTEFVYRSIKALEMKKGLTE